MSKMSKAVSAMHEENVLRRDEVVTNFMGGNSYVINPLDTLKMITASSIYGEPSYYRDSNSSNKMLSRYTVDYLVTDTCLPDSWKGKTTESIMEEAIDNALSYDFVGTLNWAVELRTKFNMRLNPQVIMVRAAMHPDRKKFTEEHPGKFNEYNKEIMFRADEPMSQMAYYMFKNNGKKNNVPSILKRSWADKLSKLGRYTVAKYKNHEIGMINAVRICHANSDVINELMKNGTVEVEENEKTWENLRSAGKSWIEIFETVNMGHMALLRNLRGVFTEVNDLDFCNKYLDKLKSGVIAGKQFPFRYYTAIKSIENDFKCHHVSRIVDALEECMDIAIENFPKLKGKTMCLSDNSGSAWGMFNSEYGSTTIAEIDNLSSVITAACSDEGYVGKFGDELKVIPIAKRRGILNQAEKISSNKGNDVGVATEGGIWKFFRDAIKNKEHWDNIFIYSDQQAGHGGLYGTYEDQKEYFKNYRYSYSHINVYKLILDYRKNVNPNVNVFCVQTAGYNNVLIPELAYRTAIQYGWTGKEAVFAQEYIRQWDEIESRNNS